MFLSSGGSPNVPRLNDMTRELVAFADAAVGVWAEREPGVLRLLEMVEAKVKPTDPPPEPEAGRGLPD